MIQQRAADAGMATAIGLPVASWLSTANEIVQIIAGLVAIVSGCFAIWHYWQKRRQP